MTAWVKFVFVSKYVIILSSGFFKIFFFIIIFLSEVLILQSLLYITNCLLGPFLQHRGY